MFKMFIENLGHLRNFVLYHFFKVWTEFLEVRFLTIFSLNSYVSLKGRPGNSEKFRSYIDLL